MQTKPQTKQRRIIRGFVNRLSVYDGVAQKRARSYIRRRSLPSVRPRGYQLLSGQR
jgi:hypothetical protein